MNLERSAAVIGGMALICMGVHSIDTTAGYTAGIIMGFVFISQGLYGGKEDG